MKFICLSKELSDSISSLSRIAVKNNNNPLLEQIFLKVEDHNLILRATNLELVVEKNLSIKGEINGSVLVKASIFSKVISNLSKNNQNITIEKVNNSLVISTQEKENELEIDIIEENSFPNLPQSQSTLVNLSKNEFILSLKSVAFCSAMSDIKPEIASVYLYSNNGELCAVSTDSYRLAEKKLSMAVPEDFRLIIPIKNVNLIVSLLDEIQDEDLVIENYNEGIILSTKNTFIATRVINGTFPDYKQLFPKEFTLEMKTNKQDIVDALQLTTYIATNYVFCNFKLDIEKQEILLSAKEKSIGSVKKIIKLNEVKNTENFSEIDVNYNSNYFLEGLQKVDNNNIYLKFTTAQRPMFISSESDLSFTYLLMPLNR